MSTPVPPEVPLDELGERGGEFGGRVPEGPADGLEGRGPATATRSASRRKAKPGWYDDPADADDTFRWWTGTGWTAWLSDDEDAPPPPEDDPRTRGEVPPGPPRRFGLVPRIVMGLTAVVILVAGIIVAGWDNRRPIVLNKAQPTSTYSPLSMTLLCDAPTANIAGEIGYDVPDGFISSGPDEGPMDWVTCLTRPSADLDANVVFALGHVPADVETRSVQEIAEEVQLRMSADLFEGGRADTSELASGAASEFGQAWRMAGVWTTADGSGQDFEIIVFDLGEGRRALYWSVISQNDVPDAERTRTEELRTSLRRL
ncbi:DUF2510 domain-containing protein [Propionibacteriaceae bacterium Y2011]|uniref:DUF2510 domain-containing protein n=1 Tax=Microlunatus sp. Y2014 TaxID=3418488 RepID=UPI003B45DFA5